MQVSGKTAVADARDFAPIGRIVSVTGSQAVIMLDQETGETGDKRAELGAILKIDTPSSVLLGIVSALSVPVPSQKEGEPEIRIAELELIGQLPKEKDGGIGSFRRGVSGYPSLGDVVDVASGEELRRAYMWNSAQAVSIGTLMQDRSIPAMVQVDELLGKHCAILGSTGTGKSCGVAVVLRAILEQNEQAHILLLDPHSEYAQCFGDAAEVITPDDLQLPFWLLTFEELIEVVIGDTAGKASAAELLAEMIPTAKRRYAANRGRENGTMLKRGTCQTGNFTVDTPVPYRISDVLAMINEQKGRLENRGDVAPYRQLRTRLEAISCDPRYAFMFGSLTIQDHMAEIVGRLFRVPVDKKPIAILELTGVPSEIVNVVVSVICRMTFDFALWSGGKVPVTLVCEEAHRYVPNDPAAGFEPTRRAIARIAKEGRKYGVSLCVVSQRPSELDSTILSQCNTVFAMRMSNDRDQNFVRAAIFDTAASLLDFLPSMGPREAIVFGDGVTLPGRIRFTDLPEHAMPRSRTASFTQQWQHCEGEPVDVDDVVERWRAADSPKLNTGLIASEPEPAAGEAAPMVQPQPVQPPPDHPARQSPAQPGAPLTPQPPIVPGQIALD
ncbi:AAA-like domain protein [bacterium BMS3Bbin10]|nr:AAA-like domain protein [bacterium BMS3Bbin10]